MPAVNQKELLTDAVKTWDGYKFAMMARREAKKLVKAGTLQIAENISAAELKFAKDFAPETGQKKGYNTRSMKAAV